MRWVFFVLMILSAIFSVFLVNTLEPYFNKVKKKEKKKDLIIIVPMKSFAETVSGKLEYRAKPIINNYKKLDKNKAIKMEWSKVNTKIEDYELEKRDKLAEPTGLKNTIKGVIIQGLFSSANTDSLVKQKDSKSTQLKESTNVGLKLSKNRKYAYVNYKQITNKTLQIHYYDLLGAFGKELRNNNSIELNILSESMIYKSENLYNIHAPVMLGLRYNQTIIKRDKFNINANLGLFSGENSSYKKALQLGFVIPFNLGYLESGYKKAFRGTRIQNQYYTGPIDIEDNELFLNIGLEF